MLLLLQHVPSVITQVQDRFSAVHASTGSMATATDTPPNTELCSTRVKLDRNTESGDDSDDCAKVRSDLKRL